MEIIPGWDEAAGTFCEICGFGPCESDEDGNVICSVCLPGYIEFLENLGIK